MALKNSSSEYGTLSKALHWVMALVIIGLIAVGFYMGSLEDNEAAKQLRRELIGMHKSVGVLAMVLILARLAWVRISPAPVLPAVFADKERLVVKGLQSLLYVLMLLLPLSGYLMSTAKGYPTAFFGLFELPMLFGKSEGLAEFAEEAHELMGFAIAALILLHMAGAIKHRLKNKGGESDILQRML